MTYDAEASQIVGRYLQVDPLGVRTGQVIRQTFDQIYDGRHTGRFSFDQLSKTERTHIGSLVEINLRREFTDLFTDGEKLDFAVGGIEIDCKYSMRFGGWMIPPEAIGELLLVCTASDSASEWSIGVIRATEARLNKGNNRDAKRTLRKVTVSDVDWIHDGATLPENTLLHIDPSMSDRILSHSSGQMRVNDLLRSVTLRPVSRETIETVAQQADPMKRLRRNGGATTLLANEGILVVGGTYELHRSVARDLGVIPIARSEVISIPVVPATPEDVDTVLLDNRLWRVAHPGETPAVLAPQLPLIRRSQAT